MKCLKVILSLLVCFAALLGDHVVFKSKLSNNSHVFRAVSDSLVHGTVGFLSSVLFFCHGIGSISTYATVCNVVFCTLLSSLIDVDHAIAAKSISLKDMTNLKNRPILHCTSLWLLISTFLLIYSYLEKKLNIYILSFMIIIAYTSHHIRDANRRGLWLYPFGHTPPLNNVLYITLLGILPNVFGMICKYIEPALYKHSVMDFRYKITV